MFESTQSKLGITELVLRDGHQSLVATRMSIDDMLPIAAKLDKIGYWSVESWGGATFDACIRYLGEDPWDRIRELKKAMPNTPQQMLLRGQNLLGYKHYADDVVDSFVEKSAANGVDVFRVFDALNDTRNMVQAIKAVIKTGKHAQGTLSYTVSPVHNLDYWLDLATEIADMGVDSIVIKDMAGLLKPYIAFELVKRIKTQLSIPVHMQCHATTGMATATLLKAIEAGIDNVDTSISPFSHTYGHSATESVVSILQDTARDTGLDLLALEEIATYFRPVRKKYSRFEGMLKGIDSRILVNQVPGGMLTNMENQLKEQNALDRLDDVLSEITLVRKDLGYLPLVTPTSQIVGTQAVINVLAGVRYKSITKEVANLIKGEYGRTPATIDADLCKRVLDDAGVGAKIITHRFADDLAPEMESYTTQLTAIAKEQNITLRKDRLEEEVLIYALFAQTGVQFLKNRDNPDAFEKASYAKVEGKAGNYQVTVGEHSYTVNVNEAGQVSQIGSSIVPQSAPPSQAAPSSGSQTIVVPLSGRILQVLVKSGDVIAVNQVVAVIEAMKMETEIKASSAGVVAQVNCVAGDAVNNGTVVLTFEPA